MERHQRTPLETCPILTTTLNAAPATVQDRMPVILSPEVPTFMICGLIRDLRM